MPVVVRQSKTVGRKHGLRNWLTGLYHQAFNDLIALSKFLNHLVLISSHFERDANLSEFCKITWVDAFKICGTKIWFSLSLSRDVMEGLDRKV